MTHSPVDAAAYERYVNEHWETMPSFEQEQARAYFQQKYDAILNGTAPETPAAVKSESIFKAAAKETIYGHDGKNWVRMLVRAMIRSI